MKRASVPTACLSIVLGCWLQAPPRGEERTATFDAPPGWDGRNHRAGAPAPRTIRQDFGYSRTRHAGGEAPGEIGGFITPAGEAAFYARRITARTFDDRLSASGTLAAGGRQFHALIGFFNADSVKEWRTPNTIALRIYGRGDVFYAYVEYATAKWRAGGDSPRPFATTDPESGRQTPRGFAGGGAVHCWSIDYDPRGNGGRGVVRVDIDGESAECHLDPGHKEDGALFNRFGLLNVVKHADAGGEIWLDDVTVNGEASSFDRDPNWHEHGNRRTYPSRDVRPRFDFGHSRTHHAGGEAAGELGGLVFRGDCRHADRLAFYGDRLAALSLEKPLRAAGRISLLRGVSDSTTLVGFFHSTTSVEVNPSQKSGLPKNFLGIAVEGPSAEGFFLYPVYRIDGDGQGLAGGPDRPRLLPDGSTHEFTLEYSPDAADRRGRITVSVEGRTVNLDLGEGHRMSGARFDRFGIVTTWIDGNGQEIYLDDLTYTCRQE